MLVLGLDHHEAIVVLALVILRKRRHSIAGAGGVNDLGILDVLAVFGRLHVPDVLVVGVVPKADRVGGRHHGLREGLSARVIGKAAVPHPRVGTIELDCAALEVRGPCGSDGSQGAIEVLVDLIRGSRRDSHDAPAVELDGPPKDRGHVDVLDHKVIADLDVVQLVLEVLAARAYGGSGVIPADLFHLAGLGCDDASVHGHVYGVGSATRVLAGGSRTDARATVIATRGRDGATVDRDLARKATMVGVARSATNAGGVLSALGVHLAPLVNGNGHA